MPRQDHPRYNPRRIPLPPSPSGNGIWNTGPRVLMMVPIKAASKTGLCHCAQRVDPIAPVGYFDILCASQKVFDCFHFSSWGFPAPVPGNRSEPSLFRSPALSNVEVNYNGCSALNVKQNPAPQGAGICCRSYVTVLWIMPRGYSPNCFPQLSAAAMTMSMS